MFISLMWCVCCWCWRFAVVMTTLKQLTVPKLSDSVTWAETIVLTQLVSAAQTLQDHLSLIPSQSDCHTGCYCLCVTVTVCARLSAQSSNYSSSSSTPKQSTFSSWAPCELMFRYDSWPVRLALDSHLRTCHIFWLRMCPHVTWGPGWTQRNNQTGSSFVGLNNTLYICAFNSTLFIQTRSPECFTWHHTDTV